MGVREYRRTPILLALLLFAPIYLIGLFQLVMPAKDIPLQLASGVTVTTSIKSVLGLLMTPLAGALIGGLTGLFVMQTSQDSDRRLVVAGYRPYQVVLARLSVLASVGALVTCVSMGTLLLTGVIPERLALFALATLFTTLVYGLVGVLIGSVLDTLSGVYLLMFGPLIDLFLYQNPLASETPTVANYLPGHFPMRLAIDTAFTDSIATDQLLGSLAVLVVLVVLVMTVFYRKLDFS